MSEIMTKKLRKVILIFCGILVAGILLYLLYRDYRPEIDVLMHSDSHTKTKLLYLIRQHEVRDSLFLLGLITVLNAIPGMSNSVFCILAGLCYGPWIGLAINWCGNIIGNCIVASLIKRVSFSHNFKKNKLLNWLMNQEHPSLGMTLGFMVPVIPSVLVDYTAVRLGIPVNKFLLMVIVGMFPTSFIYAFGGDAIFNGDFKKLAGALIGVAILFIMAWWLVSMASKKRERAE
ncbi:hypothetical protein GTO82_08255 [Lactobacillus johnsonii]|uniref:TVP38/TMEM64 family membrane protein n=2 Tax=Lactobacillus johnsonii TaxID=33959 RepID=A0A9X7Y6M6_LACJH|nr:hypothetical protein GTO82_08255 [Lactobacillus johnsonii]